MPRNFYDNVIDDEPVDTEDADNPENYNFADEDVLDPDAEEGAPDYDEYNHGEFN